DHASVESHVGNVLEEDGLRTGELDHTEEGLPQVPGGVLAVPSSGSDQFPYEGAPSPGKGLTRRTSSHYPDAGHPDETGDSADDLLVRKTPVHGQPRMVRTVRLQRFAVDIDTEHHLEARGREPQTQPAGPAEQVGREWTVDLGHQRREVILVLA